MTIVPILVVVAFAILAMYLFLNKKSDDKDREGIVRDILQKDALAIDFGDGRSVVVKLFGITPATEAEMLDEKIFSFLDETLRGQKVSVKPVQVASTDVMSAEVRTLGGEYVNAVLVRQGFARWHVSEASGDGALGEAQQLAQSQQVGVWNPAIIQLLEDRRNSAGELSDDDIANMEVDPDEQQTKE
ncbi:thermonuclease family protein [Pelagicoccus sp. SDUM812002]|uniref:thermonuclease family protein n=1 Tax=Pelagicoccus sp. SDUM812002 TaxID=3041266 RepID=UPI00280DC737|nr:thermonuclease family protein [Pelagicoccus sp. SDUM812002]MDQ8186404.1 thermonuclease family protein [Pelagicoccus sp. SDUM812002]